MAMLPRIAVGTIQPHADPQPILWAMLEALRRQGLQVQPFLSRAWFAHFHGAAAATGLTPRHLDSWLMSPQVCRETFIRGATGCDVAMVEGEFDVACNGAPGGGSLDRLCEWLDLPRVVMLDATGCDRGLPPRPAVCDGVVIDYATDARHLAELTCTVRAAWGVPVFGGLEALPQLRAAIRGIRPGVRPPLELVERLGAAFSQHSCTEQLLNLAMRRPLAWVPRRPLGTVESVSPITVALAYDKVFDCYFPDTLDALEANGATLVDFSPLRDERLPDGIDIVYFGCGHPERFAAELADNHCMKFALRHFVHRGGRLYAEGGGLAYLCQQLETLDGQFAAMAGIYPAIARRRRPMPRSMPVETSLLEPTWLGPAGTRLRGYGSSSWYLEPAGALRSCSSDSGQRFAVVRQNRAIGSTVHVDFAAGELLRGFFQSRTLAPYTANPSVV